jgi:hypothetical protein
MPATATLRQFSEANFAWFGRAEAIIERYNIGEMVQWRIAMNRFRDPLRFHDGIRDMMILLHKIRIDLRLQTVGPTNIAVPQGGVFDYFDEIRNTIETAIQDVFFVDPYLDAEFVSRYLPHVRSGITIRLLTSDKKLNSLVSAIEVFSKQSGIAVAVRSTTGLHDRYVFIDKGSCFQSGASFKDGAKNAPTTLTQITDAFNAVWTTYEQIWTAAKTER